MAPAITYTVTLNAPAMAIICTVRTCCQATPLSREVSAGWISKPPP